MLKQPKLPKVTKQEYETIVEAATDKMRIRIEELREKVDLKNETTARDLLVVRQLERKESALES